MAATWHGALPWPAIIGLYRTLRLRFFSKRRPTGMYVVVDLDVDEMRDVLGPRSFAPNWEYSYRKRGEVLNLARVVLDDVDGRSIRWFQTHVRGWSYPTGLALRAHYEPEPTENPKAHLDGVGFDVDEGMDRLRDVLDDTGVDYRPIRWDGEAYRAP